MWGQEGWWGEVYMGAQLLVDSVWEGAQLWKDHVAGSMDLEGPQFWKDCVGSIVWGADVCGESSSQGYSARGQSRKNAAMFLVALASSDSSSPTFLGCKGRSGCWSMPKSPQAPSDSVPLSICPPPPPGAQGPGGTLPSQHPH